MEILDSSESFLHWDRNLSELSEGGESDNVLFSTVSDDGDGKHCIIIFYCQVPHTATSS